MGGPRRQRSSLASAGSAEAGAGRDHWSSAHMHGVDDLGAVDALQVHRRNPESRMAELSLDDVQRHALPGHLDRVRVTELMRRKAPPHTRTRRGTPQLLTNAARRQRTPARAPINDT